MITLHLIAPPRPPAKAWRYHRGQLEKIFSRFLFTSPQAFRCSDTRSCPRRALMKKNGETHWRRMAVWHAFLHYRGSRPIIHDPIDSQRCIELGPEGRGEKAITE